MKTTIEQFHQFRKQFPAPFQKHLSPEYFEWKFNHPSWQEGYLHLEKDGDEVMGSIAYCPKQVLVFGAQTNAAEIGDSYTSPKYQRRGVFTTCANACVSVATARQIDLIYGTPNDASLPGYEKKLNFVVASHARVGLLTRLVSAAAYSRRLIKYLKADWASQIAGRLALMINRTYFGLQSPSSELKLELVNHLPASIGEDGTWGLDRTDYAFFTIRNRRYLQWRFLDSSEPFKFYLAKVDDKVIGYVVTKLTERQGEQVGSICDFICERDSQSAAQTILRLAVQCLADAGADYVQMYCAVGTEYWESAKRNGFRAIAWNPIIFFAGHTLGREITKRSGKWHFAMADCDAV